MKRLVFLSLAGIVGLGFAAGAVVLVVTQHPDGAPGAARSVPALPASPPEPVAPPERAISGLPVPAVPAQQGPRSLQLAQGVVARDLTGALPPCHRVNAMGPGPPAVLTLELEARDGGGLVVVDARVASRGGASEGLISCAIQVLLGRRVAEGSFPPGEHFVTQVEITPPSNAADPPIEPPPTSQPISRQQLRRRGTR